MRIPSVLLALLLMVCINAAPKYSAAASDRFIAQKEVQKEEKTKDLDDLEIDDEEDIAIDDPWASWNQAMFEFNDTLYFYLMKPVGQVWKAVIPSPLREGLKNAFHNIRFPGRCINSLLQGKNDKARAELLSFLLNSTIGIGGLFDPARDYESLNTSEEDFGQTLGQWGTGHGIYLVWPFFGPSTVRDSFGWAGDKALDPLTYFTYIFDGYDFFPHSFSVGVGEKVNDLSFRIGDYESIIEAAITPYDAVKDAYLQYRKKKQDE